MAKTNGPLFSLGAHGSLSKTLNYSRRRSGDQCRKHNKPTGVPSAKQRGQRRLTEFLVAQWQNMSAADKATWADNARGTGLNLSGYHYFLRSAQKDLYTHHGLCAYWHCNEIIGDQILDLSGKGNHGTLEPSHPSNAPRLVKSVLTRFGNALSYDGVDEYVDCGNDESLKISEGSIIAWIKFNSTGVGKRNEIFSSHHTATVTGYGFTKQDDEKIYFWPGDGVSFNELISTITLSPNTKYCIVCTVNTSNRKIYINGVEKGSDTGVTIVDSNEIHKIGDHATTPGKFFNGLIDEVCVYKRVLSAAEIATRYRFALQKVS